MKDNFKLNIISNISNWLEHQQRLLTSRTEVEGVREGEVALSD